MRLRRLSFFIFVLIILALAACNSDSNNRQNRPDEPSEIADENPTSSDENSITDTLIGNLIPQTTTVEYGESINSLETIVSETAFYEKHAIRVSDGGETLMEFGQHMVLRLFNDSELDIVEMTTNRDSELRTRLFLMMGGFTGKLIEEGGEAVFELPNGATVNILGTEFFIVYNPESEIALVGNFGGSVEVLNQASSILIPDGFYVVVTPNQPPSELIPLTITFSDFELQARALQSPFAAAAYSGEWQLSMNQEWFRDTDPNFRHTVSWQGRFRLDGEQIIGEGTGTIEGQYFCGSRVDGDGSNIYGDGTGSFEFNIGGRLASKPDTNNVFELEVQGRDLNFDITPECREKSPGLSISVFEELERPELQQIVDTLWTTEVNAEHNATSEVNVALTGDLFESPLQIEVSLIPSDITVIEE